MKFDTTTAEPVQTFTGVTTTVPKGDDENTARARCERLAARIAELNHRAEYGWTHVSTVQIDGTDTVTIHDTLTAEKLSATN